MYELLLPEWNKYLAALVAWGAAHRNWDEAFNAYQGVGKMLSIDSSIRYTMQTARVAADKARDKADTDINLATGAWVKSVYHTCGSSTSIKWDEDGNCLVQGVMLFML